MATQIRYVVVGHKDRASMADNLAEELDAYISLDMGDLGSNANHDLAWRLASRDAEWSAVIEDDVELSANFHQHVQDAVANIPSDGVLSLYAGYPRPAKLKVKRAIDKALDEGSSFLKHNSLMWGPAVLMPSHLVSSMLEFVPAANQLQYDQRFSYWTSRKRIPVYYTVPSLVEHKDEPSLIWGDRPPRKAWVFGEPTSWNNRYVNI